MVGHRIIPHRRNVSAVHLGLALDHSKASIFETDSVNSVLEMQVER